MLLFVFCTLGISAAWAQKTFSGKVLGPDGLGLPGVSVVEKSNPTNGVATDIDGNWTLTVPDENSTLEFSSIGMKTISSAAKNAQQITMTDDAQMLDDVIVVAYGTAKKSTFTGSAVAVDNKKLEKIQTADAGKALEGVVPGLSVTSESGRPGEGTTLRIRGIGSLNASSAPLIVLDGAPYSGELNSINTQDIESMNVLKDAASAALYGARGANGVILITTKSGKKGKVQVTFDARIGQNQRGVPEYDIMTDPGVYYKTYWEALKNYQVFAENPVANPGKWASEQLVNNANLGYNIYQVADDKVVDENGKLTSQPIKYEDASNFNDWIGVLYKPKTRQEYNLSVTKGTEKSKIYFSLGYLNDKGFNINSGFERVSSRLSYNTKIYDWLKISASSQLAKTKTNYAADEEGNFSNTFAWTRNIAPIYPVYAHDDKGAILIDKKTGEKVYDAALNRAYGGGMNLIGQQKLNKQYYDNYYLTQNFRTDIDLPKGFKFNSTATFYANWWRYTDFKNPLIGDGKAYGGILYKESNMLQSLNWNQILTYNKEFDLFDLQAMLGHEIYSEKGNYMYGQKKSLLDPNLDELVSGATISDLNSYTQEYKVEGYFGQVTADFDDKYYVSASLRRDGSSVFAPENRWGTFWSLGASWRMKEESFLKDVEAIDNMKLRVSYGAQGNDYLYLPESSRRAFTPYTNLYKISSDGKNSVYGPEYKGNRDITWEKNKNFDVGLEFSIFKGKLSGEVDFFQRTTSDMLFNRPIPSSTGFSTEPVNFGSMRNTGFEFNLKSLVYSSEKVSVTLGVNGSTYKNKILSLPDYIGEEGLADGNLIRKVGGGIYDIYMVKYAGVNPDNGDALYYIYDDKKKDFVKTPSKDYSSDKKNKQFIGSAIPDLSGGFFANTTFYGVDFGFQFSYQLGGLVYDGIYANLMGAGEAGQNWHNDIQGHWTPENKNTDIPRVQIGTQKLISSSDRFVTDASYLSLRNVTLGYNLPASLIDRIGVKSLRVYFAADNVFLLSKRKGFDPRLTLRGSQSRSKNSAIRTLSVGLKLTL